MQAARIALRNAARQKKRTILLAGAIAFGILVITLIGSFTAGIQTSVKENFTGILGGHIYVSGQELSSTGRTLNRIGDQELLDQALLAVDVAALHIRSSATGQVIFGSRQERIRIEGVDWKAEDSLRKDLGIVEGQLSHLAENALILPDSSAQSLGIEIGESILFRTSTITGQANVGEFILAGIYPDKSEFGIISAYAGLALVNNLIGLQEAEYQHLNITVAELEKVDQVASVLYRELAAVGEVTTRDREVVHSPGRGMMSMLGSPGALGEEEEAWEGTRFSVRTINELMEPVLALVLVLRYVGAGLFAVLLVITMVGLLNTFRMVLIERTREIGTMRAVGMQRAGVRRIFLLEALFLSLFGAAMGLVAAFALMALFGNIPFAAQSAFALFTSEGTFAFPVMLRDIVRTVIILAGITVFAALLPANKAANLRPADALRTDY